MNLFVLDLDSEKAAQYNQDLHVKKICVEAVQILQNAYSENQLKQAPKTQTGNVRSHSYYNHPVCIWARLNINNFKWALSHAQALHKEFVYRFDKPHFSVCFVEWAIQNTPQLPNGAQTEHPQCFSDYGHLIVPGNPVQGYRNYYKVAKKIFVIRKKPVYAQWTRREMPHWMI